MSVVLVVGGGWIGNEQSVGVEVADNRGDLTAASARFFGGHDDSGEGASRTGQRNLADGLGEQTADSVGDVFSVVILLSVYSAASSSSRARFSYYNNVMSARTIHGQEISEEQIDLWVAEAEAGYDPEMLRRRGRPARSVSPSRAITVRLTDAELQGLEKYAHDHALTRSEVIRSAIQELVS